MKNLSKPVFILGCISILVSLVGFVMYTSQNAAGMYVFYTGLAGGAVFWIWNIAAVASSDELRSFQKMFWLIIVISVPVLGGFIYQIMHQSSNKIVT